jgi:ribose-phosphate pyrophosphokinase
MKVESTIVFSTTVYEKLADDMAHEAGFKRAKVVRELFPDGERYQRVDERIEGRDVVIVGGTISDEATLELYDLACGVVMFGARTLTMVIPYFGYCTMERAVRSGEVVTAKVRARLLSSIPEAGSGNRVVLLDLHSPGIAHYFEAGIRPFHLYAKPMVLNAARRMGGKHFVVACTDAGRAKWVESLANDLGVDAAFVYKRRLDGEHTEVAGVSAKVQGRTVVIYDDMIRTGSSLLQAARAYRDAGAIEIYAIATHGLFPGDSLPRIQSSGLIREIVCSDSHPRATSLASSFLRVDSIAGLLADYLKAIPCA